MKTKVRFKIKNLSNDRVKELEYLSRRLREYKKNNDSIGRWRIQAIEKALNEATREEPELRSYILKNISEGVPFSRLKAQGVPCSHNLFYKCRRRYFENLNEQIDLLDARAIAEVNQKRGKDFDF